MDVRRPSARRPGRHRHRGARDARVHDLRRARRAYRNAYPARANRVAHRRQSGMGFARHRPRRTHYHVPRRRRHRDRRNHPAVNGALVTGPGARIVTGALVTPPPPVKGALVPSARDSIAATMRRTGPDGGFTGPLPPKNYYHEAVLADTPALFWTFDESSGNYADASGNGHVGTAAATIVRVPGRITGGLAVNGDAQTAMVTTPNSAALNTAPLTFEFWWRHGGAVGQYGMTVIKTSDGNWQDGY